MSFKMSDTQFMQMFAVMQSVRLIDSYSNKGGCSVPKLMWQNNGGVHGQQFGALTHFVAKTPYMATKNSDVMALPVIIDPFVDGGYVPFRGPCIQFMDNETRIVENAEYTLSPSSASAIQHLNRQVNDFINRNAVHGAGFCDFNIDGSSFSDKAELVFDAADGRRCVISCALPYSLHEDSEHGERLRDVITDFVRRSLYGARTEHTKESVHRVEEERKAVITASQIMAGNPLWASW